MFKGCRKKPYGIKVEKSNGTAWVKIFGEYNADSQLYKVLRRVKECSEVVLDCMRAKNIKTPFLATLYYFVRENSNVQVRVIGNDEERLREKARVYGLGKIERLTFV